MAAAVLHWIRKRSYGELGGEEGGRRIELGWGGREGNSFRTCYANILVGCDTGLMGREVTISEVGM